MKTAHFPLAGAMEEKLVLHTKYVWDGQPIDSEVEWSGEWSGVEWSGVYIV